MGKGGPSTRLGGKNTVLLYDEKIVYDVSQIRMRYLLKVEFKYKNNRWW